MNKNKVKIKTKGTKITPVTITIVSLGAFLMMFGVSIYPNLMGNSVSESNKYIVNYNANGGTGHMRSKSIKVGEVVQLDVNKFKRNGYRFNGWRVKRGDGSFLCYIDDTKTNNSWTEVSYCNQYGYVLYGNEVYIKDITTSGDVITLYADWVK